jgi:hypothetical protein
MPLRLSGATASGVAVLASDVEWLEFSAADERLYSARDNLPSRSESIWSKRELVWAPVWAGEERMVLLIEVEPAGLPGRAGGTNESDSEADRGLELGLVVLGLDVEPEL